MLGTSALLLSSLGGWLAGLAADRYGRVRVLQVTILWFAFFTFLSGFASGFTQLLDLSRLAGPGIWRRVGGGFGADRRNDSKRVPGPGCGNGAGRLGDRLGNLRLVLHAIFCGVAAMAGVARDVLGWPSACVAGLCGFAAMSPNQTSLSAALQRRRLNLPLISFRSSLLLCSERLCLPRLWPWARRVAIMQLLRGCRSI